MRRQKEVCEWCCEGIDPQSETRVEGDYGPYCNGGCRQADSFFRFIHSDEEYNRRWHYAYLTRGIA